MAFACSCSGDVEHKVGRDVSEETPPILDQDTLRRIANDRREDEKAGLDVMDKFAAKFSVRSLRKKEIPAGVMEVRIWIGISPDTTRGLILMPREVKYLAPIGDVARQKLQPPRQLVPKSGWDEFWNVVRSSGLLEIPEEPQAERIEPRLDSDGITVEIKEGDVYRYIFYHAPCISQTEHATKLVTAVGAIGQNMGLDFYSCPTFQ